MENILVEIIGSHTCSGYNDARPETVRKFCEEAGVHVDFKVCQA